MKFKAYLRQRRVHNTPNGDFVTDALADGGFPDDFLNVEELESYLAMHHACDEAIAAGKRVWRAYARRHRSGPPQVRAQRLGAQAIIACPYCGHIHYHGWQSGHRAAHCRGKRAEAGYILICDD